MGGEGRGAYHLYCCGSSFILTILTFSVIFYNISTLYFGLDVFDIFKFYVANLSFTIISFLLRRQSLLKDQISLLFVVLVVSLFLYLNVIYSKSQKPQWKNG